MARAKPAGKLAEIADAALTAFGRNGFRLTQMADIAKLCGMSAGALYGYVDNKEALLYAAVLKGLGSLDPAMPLPVHAASTDELVAVLKREIGGRSLWPHLKTALTREKPDNFADEAREIAGELYDLIAQERRLIRLFSICSRDVPEIAEFHTYEVRGRYLADFSAFLAKRHAGGHVKAELATPVAARAGIEMVAWMAAHRHNEAIQMQVTEAEARATVQAFFAAALA
jgi:AcrR family transcriptional regulator